MKNERRKKKRIRCYVEQSNVNRNKKNCSNDFNVN